MLVHGTTISAVLLTKPGQLSSLISNLCSARVSYAQVHLEFTHFSPSALPPLFVQAPNAHQPSSRTLTTLLTPHGSAPFSPMQRAATRVMMGTPFLTSTQMPSHVLRVRWPHRLTGRTHRDSFKAGTHSKTIQSRLLKLNSKTFKKTSQGRRIFFPTGQENRACTQMAILEQASLPPVSIRKGRACLITETIPRTENQS